MKRTWGDSLPLGKSCDTLGSGSQQFALRAAGEIVWHRTIYSGESRAKARESVDPALTYIACGGFTKLPDAPVSRPATRSLDLRFDLADRVSRAGIHYGQPPSSLGIRSHSVRG